MSRRYDLAPELQRTFDDFLINLGRVENLIKVYEASSGRGRGRKIVLDADVLRAAVVFAHAALEDFIRSICGYFLPRATAAVLDEIPLTGLNSSGRPEKFFLGRLVAHRDKTIEDLIEESVQMYLERLSFSSTQDIATAITRCGLDVWTV
jgi:hypothetical protein